MVQFAQNVFYHMKDDFFVENSKSQKNYFSWVTYIIFISERLQKRNYYIDDMYR